MTARKMPKIPAFDDLAILLDIDGTILDLAPTPQKVAVPPSLYETLRRLNELTGGAVAFVTGRSLSDLDRLFTPLQLPAVAGHGAEYRFYRDGARDEARIAALDQSLKRKFAALARGASGVLFEDKDYAVALHYRQAPEQEHFVRDAVAGICAAEPSIEVLPGKYVLEVKKSGFSKATGVRELMKHPPFAGRRPIFIGDDATDEFVFAIMPEFDGLAFSVGDAVGGVDAHFEQPKLVREWLSAIAGLDAGATP